MNSLRTCALVCSSLVTVLWGCSSDTILVIETTPNTVVEDTGLLFPTRDATLPPWTSSDISGGSGTDTGPLGRSDAAASPGADIDPEGSVNLHTPCAIPGFVAGPELCDGVDNDCDGTIDDNAPCSDLNPCTLDVCYSEPNSGFCVHTNVPDGYFCDDNKSCMNGQCVGASPCGNGLCGAGEDCETCPYDCGECAPDVTWCGDGLCGPEESCSTCEQDCGPCLSECEPGACDDGDPCTVGDTCVNGFCVPGDFPLSCNDSPDCQTGTCEAGVGCAYAPFPDDTPCGAGWTCQSGTCTPQTVGAGTIVISEIMPNPSEVVDKKGEWFELYNTTSQSIDINGWAIGDASGNIHNIVSDTPVLILGKGYVVLTLDGDSSDNGNINTDYSYKKTSGNPDFYLNNDWDHLTLYWVGMIIDRVDYATGFGWPVESGVSMQLSANALDDDANDDPGFWCLSTSAYGLGDLGTPGGANKVCP